MKSIWAILCATGLSCLVPRCHAAEPVATSLAAAPLADGRNLPAPGRTKKAVIDFSAARQHWAYQPIRSPELPPVTNRRWAQSPVDRFVLAQLEGKSLAPSPAADRRTLLRRLYNDLIGLPPSFEELEQFVRDPTPEAYEKQVNALLASPRFGERWGRHWLDVARYAETKDLVLLYGRDRLRPFAYTFRDYVIRALNEDVPFDQFVVDQIAADQTAPKDQAWRLGAMGFLTVGRLFDENPHDIYDDQIDTVTRGFLGLTVACARCHDHKYDAVSTADYYALYGVFASSERPLDAPLLQEPKDLVGGEEFEKRLAAKRQELQEHVDREFNEITEAARLRSADYLVQVATGKANLGETAIFFLSLSPEDLRPGLLTRWRRYVEQHAKARDPVFGPWHDLMQLADERFNAEAKPVLARWQTVTSGTNEGQINPHVQAALLSLTPSNRTDIARTYGTLFRNAYEQSKKLAAAKDEAREQLVSILTGRDGPIYFPRNKTFLHMSRVPRDRFGTLTTELDKIAAYATNPPAARAMVLQDAAELYEPVVFLRGNPNTPGPHVPRRMLTLLGGDQNPPFKQGSGRLELARAIAARDNPLTSRVFANRVWMHLLGEPLVSTPSDFGTRSTPPTHPALLDHLAWHFLEQGGSLKKLVREIVLSNTYQQSSQDRADARAIDPDNKLLWRAHKRRLDFEVMRDSLLAISGRLDIAMGGRSVDVANDPQCRRRTIYGLVDRQDVPQVFRAFDFASPDQSASRRPQTIVPQQALFALNSPFLLLQAKALASRLDPISERDAEQRIRMLYRLVLAREASSEEVATGMDFIRTAQGDAIVPATQLSPWQQYAQVLLLTNELMFID